jgi:beta-N-acetylhexosaminidase
MLKAARGSFARWVVLGVVLAVVSGCGSPLTPGPGSSGPIGSSSPPVNSPTADAPPPSPTSSPTSCVQTLLASLSEPQRVGQLFLLGLAADRLDPATAAAIAAQHLGSVWFTEETTEGVAGVRAVADAVQALATPGATGGVRFFVAANQEGGLIQALRGAGFSTIPAALAQGALPTAALETDAAAWGRQLRAAGVNLDFAPVFDVVPAGTDAQNQPIGALQREYGHDAATAGGHAAAFVRGMAQAGIATTAKHFPGLGRVVGNTDFTSGVVDSVTTPDDPYLASFAAGVGAGVPFVMVALATYQRIDPVHLAAFSPAVMALLRGSMGFRGVIVSDDLGATAAVAAMTPAARALDFIAAGGDMIIVKTAAPATAMAAALVVRAASDRAFAARVDDAALRILEAKAASGLMPCV